MSRQTTEFPTRAPLEVRKSWHAAEGPGGSYTIHSGACHLSHRGVMQDVECTVVDARPPRHSCRESKARVPVGRHMCRPHREGEPVVGELDEPGELFVIQGRVRAEDANRRPGSRLRTLEVF